MSFCIKNTILAYFGRPMQEKFLGWESWYNYYEKIDENKILSDLNQINQSPNLIKLAGQDFPEYKKVFQIDDGWQISLGDWNWTAMLYSRCLRPAARYSFPYVVGFPYLVL